MHALSIHAMTTLSQPFPDGFRALRIAARHHGVRMFAASSAIAACCAAPCAAQLRVVGYNVAQLNGDQSDLLEVLAAMHDDDKPGFASPVGVFVFQEVRAGNVGTLLAIVNNAAPRGVTYALATYTNTAEDDFGGAQALFFRTDLLSEVVASHADIYTGAGRDADRWKLQLIGYASPAAALWIYSAHLKASVGFESERLSGAQSLRNNANTLGSGVNIIYAGDLNLYVNTEPAYLHFLSRGNSQAFDPLGAGSWAGPGNAVKHTQSPRLNSSSALVGGGLDDRFDFQLSSAALHDGVGLSIASAPFAYRSFGNDGAHYNTSINVGNNGYFPGQVARSNALAAALFDASDHIPLIVDYQIPARLAATMPSTFGRVIQNATHSLAINVTNPAPVESAIGADVLQFSATGSLALSGAVLGEVAAHGDVDNIAMPLNTSVVGNAVARVTLASSSQAVQPAMLTVDSSGTIIRHANPSFSDASDDNATTISAECASGSGIRVIAVPVHNFGFDLLQAMLDVDSVTGLDEPFSFVGVGAGDQGGGIGASPAVLEFAFDSTGVAPGLHQALATIHLSDEDLPGAGSFTLSLSIEVAVTDDGQCPADINNDSMVNVTDLLATISQWGPCPASPAPCQADVVVDGFVNVSDLLAVISAWGGCP